MSRLSEVKAEIAKWAKSSKANRNELAESVGELFAEQTTDYSRSELAELACEWAFSGTKGFSEMSVEELVEEALNLHSIASEKDFEDEETQVLFLEWLRELGVRS